MLPRFESLAIILWIGLTLVGCSKNSTGNPGKGSDTVAAIPGNDPAPPLSHDKTLPYEGLSPGYAGSKSCVECHEDQHVSWFKSFHRTMTQYPSPTSVKATFKNVILTNNQTRFSLSQRSNDFWVKMESVVPLAPNLQVPEPVEVPMGLVTGSHHMQVFWIANGMGNCQIGFPFSWLIPEKRWVPRNSTFLRPPTTEHKPETWNFVCSRCHATGTEPNLDRKTKTWQTAVGELGISCEACHGPAKDHLSWAKEKRDSAKRGSADRKNPPISAQLIANDIPRIVHPGKINPRRASQICGFCHSMKYFDNNSGWPDHGFTYRPGDDLDATTPVMRPNHLEEQPWLVKHVEKNPTLFEDFFWSDGMIRVSGREYNGLIESPCYTSEKFSCLSCHSMHDSDPDDQLARNRTDNRACLQCHSKFNESAQLTAHTHHAESSSGSECYNCHMPHTTYGVLKAIRSHQISSPKAANELATGRPNACNLCHLDKSLGWTAETLALWYRQSSPMLTEDLQKIPDSVRLALAGDAGQRALVAWHYGWKPALQISGNNWMSPIVNELLQDSYEAIQHVTRRSIQEPLFPPAISRERGRDLTLPKSLSNENDPLANGAIETSTIQRLLRERNQHSIRLRE